MDPDTPARMQRHRTLPQRLAHIGQSWITAVRQSALEAAMYCAELEQAEAQRRLGGAQAVRVASAEGLATEPVPRAGDPAPRHLFVRSRSCVAAGYAEDLAFVFEDTNEPASA